LSNILSQQPSQEDLDEINGHPFFRDHAIRRFMASVFAIRSARQNQRNQQTLLGTPYVRKCK
ncbi:hypothetical protein BaRGS_00031983, partial [Batillaria attramentaria]